MVDALVEDVGISEGLVGEMMGLEVTPDDLDVVEFGCIFRQPLDGEPMGTLGERGPCRLADVDRAVVEHHDDRLRGGLATSALEGIVLQKSFWGANENS